MLVTKVADDFAPGEGQIKVWAAMQHIDAVRVDVMPVDGKNQPCELAPEHENTIAGKAWVVFRNVNIPMDNSIANLWFEVTDAGLSFVFSPLLVEQLEETLKFCDADLHKRAN